MNAPATLTDIERIYPPTGNVFPTDLLDGGIDALCMFAAGFYGTQDAYWINKAGLTATCIDVNTDRLAVMQSAYPADWEFLNCDAFDYIANTDRTFDIVTADAPSETSDRCISELPALLAVTGRACIISVHTEMNAWYDIVGEALTLPDRWTQTGLVYRSSSLGGCYWLTVERDR